MPRAEVPPFAHNGHITFGSFNQAMKLSRFSRRLWAEILARLPDSRLLVLGVPEGRAQDELWRDLSAAGVDRERITILPYLLLPDYFARLAAADIALDTAPFSGGTTTCDALWMGVPVITLPGSRPSSRSAASILTTAGLADWIASTPGDYVRLAVEFSGNKPMLAAVRKSLRERFQHSPLMDEKRFVRDLEAIYRDMWRRWCESDGR
jgi:predicted O-linked N-acetylglucosamine transferase (SPINDLY family)